MTKLELKRIPTSKGLDHGSCLCTHQSINIVCACAN